MSYIEIETTVAKEDSTGRDYLIFTPVFKVSQCGQGEIRLPRYEVFLDESEKIAAQREKAMETAKSCLKHILENL